MMSERGLNYWLPTYVAETLHRQRLRAARSRQLTHLLFLVCDHYEPRHQATEPGQPAARLQAWHHGYRRMQDECFQKHGLRPLHTWFYPPHHGAEHLPALARMAFEGLGEVELHYHHRDDTRETLRSGLQQALARYHRAGLLLQQGNPPGGGFGFIHGDWALDNSANGRFCGVNGELSLLQELGCWADLTMPSSNECQTRKINSIYYAVDDPRRAKSHDWGDDARAGHPARAGLLLIQGPLGINLRGPRYPRIENASLTSANWGSPRRIRSWIDCHVHVRGRPQWLFIKLHTHGAIEADFDALFGEKARAMHAELAQQYNDGRRFKLHYLTARQAFNVVRAAEQGRDGDPAQYFDYELPPPVTALYCANAPHDVRCCTPHRLRLDGLETDSTSSVLLRYPGLVRVAGRIRALEVRAENSVLELELHDGSAPVSVHLAAGATLRSLSGARVVGQGGSGELALSGAGPIRLEYQLLPQRAVVGG
jgi:hypothetical protein